MSIKRLHVGPRLSQVAIHGDTVYTAGIVADDTNVDVAGQTGQILDKIDQYLKEAGTDKTQILSATIWLADIKDFAADELGMGPVGAERQYSRRAPASNRSSRHPPTKSRSG